MDDFILNADYGEEIQDDTGIGNAAEALGGSLAGRILAGRKAERETPRSRIELCREGVRKKLQGKTLDEETRQLAIEILDRQSDEFYIRRMAVFADGVIAEELIEWATEKRKKQLRAAAVPTAEQAEEAARAARAAAAERERLQREHDRTVRRTAFGSAPRRHADALPLEPTAEESARARALEDVHAIVEGSRFITLPVPDGVRAAVARTAHYMRLPGDRPTVDIYREEKLKTLSPRSAKDYERTRKQIAEELGELGASTTWDKVAYLASVAQMLEVSSYKRIRAALLRMAEENGDHALGRAIRSMPHYGELCVCLERKPSKRSTSITEARRAAQDEGRFLRLLARLSPQYTDAIAVMRYTGCRAVEAASVQLTVTGDTVRVSVRNAKTGARKRRKDETMRTFDVALSSPEGQLLADIAARRGPTPCAGLTSEGIRAAWARARRWEAVQNDENWCLHALRHQFARDYKSRLYTRLKGLHGTGWREHLYGSGWADEKIYTEAIFGPLAAMLGHTSTQMSKIYG